MPTLLARRPTFLLKHRPAESATVFDFNAFRAAALLPTLDDGRVRFDDDESGIALVDLPYAHLDQPESDVFDHEAEPTVEAIEHDADGVWADDVDAAGETSPNDDTVAARGAFHGHGTVAIETGRPEEEDRKSQVKALRLQVKAATAAAKAAATKATSALKAKTKAEDKVGEREAVAATLTGTAQVREQAKVATARLAVERATAEAERLVTEAEEAERVQIEAEEALHALETLADQPGDVTPEVKYLNHCIADSMYRPGGRSVDNAQHTDDVFYQYDGTYWVPQTDEDNEYRAASFTLQHTADKATSRLVYSMLSFALMFLRKEHAKPAPGKGKIYVQLKNAVLEIVKAADGTVSILAHKPAPRFGTTACIQASIDWKRVGPLDSKGSGVYTTTPLGKASLFGEFILSACHDDPAMVDYVAEAMGSTVTGDKTWRKAILLVGPKGSGKSTFQSLLTRVFHPAWAAVEPEKWAENFAMESMVGKTLYIASETENFPAKEFKAVVASDMINVTRKGKASINMIPRGRLIIATNEPPRYRDDPSGAIADRLCCIPWDVQAETKPGGINTDLVEQIVSNPAELLQMVDFVIDGAVRLVQRGRFMADADAPAPVRSLKARVIASNNPVSSFVDAYNVKAANAGEFTPKFEVYPLYVKHCQATGIKEQYRLNEVHFWRNMYAFFGTTWPRHQRGGIDYVPLLVKDVVPV
ncbi:hypothetical protein DBB29_08725 [Pandoraea cepalis]|uniref:SF3 helicase domain-containing protein n=1 Tax=Pandoraea cepalis TaxID=2508294 RepID=A0AAW7MLQ2_9BURK|nr:DUF5906 domain-containing protein [Pandoraea cepalis]MDN4573657.1 hypothetical protein [Pandoraea cepalis]MDN4578199.1 hypothetical protein [Pandoraea cepalis]